MAKINWNEFQERAAANEERQGSRVGFFALKNDGDKAVVRIMHDSPDDFDMLAIHRLAVEGQRFGRAVSCLRGPKDPIDMCPACAAGEKVNLRLYIHLIEYVKDENGQVVAVPKIWERSMSYAKTLADYISEYGPLSDMLFTIKRSGAKGSMETTYTVLPANEKIYPQDVYYKDDSLFADYSVLGTAVADKDYEGMMEMLENAPTQSTQPAQATTYQPKTNYQAPAQPAPRPTYEAAVQQTQHSEEQARTYREPTVEAAQPRPTYQAPAQPAAEGNAQPRPRRYF